MHVLDFFLHGFHFSIIQNAEMTLSIVFVQILSIPLACKAHEIRDFTWHITVLGKCFLNERS